MELKNHPNLDISESLLEAIRSFPLQREVEHCGARMAVAPFDIYADCPRCGTRLKVRSFSATGEVEDVFDAVFEWMNQPMAQEVARCRQRAIEADQA